jgi:formate/nitrite transporter FocA (FNT family)
MTDDNTVTSELSATPVLSEGEKEIVEERTALRAAVIHEAIREQGETELARPVVALAWSGLAAGLSMGFSMISEGLLESYLPAASWRPLISKLGYTVGFLVVILGRQQLFTENTLTVICRCWRGALRQRCWLSSACGRSCSVQI